MANAKVYGVPSQNAIVMRATPDELLLAQKLVNDLDKARPEVVVDIAVLEVSSNKMRQYRYSIAADSFGQHHHADDRDDNLDYDDDHHRQHHQQQSDFE